MNSKQCVLICAAAIWLLVLAARTEGGVTFHPPVKDKSEGQKKKTNPKRTIESALAVDPLETMGDPTIHKECRLSSNEAFAYEDALKHLLEAFICHSGQDLED